MYLSLSSTLSIACGSLESYVSNEWKLWFFFFFLWWGIGGNRKKNEVLRSFFFGRFDIYSNCYRICQYIWMKKVILLFVWLLIKEIERKQFLNSMFMLFDFKYVRNKENVCVYIYVLWELFGFYIMNWGCFNFDVRDMLRIAQIVWNWVYCLEL